MAGSGAPHGDGALRPHGEDEGGGAEGVGVARQHLELRQAHQVRQPLAAHPRA